MRIIANTRQGGPIKYIAITNYNYTTNLTGY